MLKIYWTEHAKIKMRQYGLSKSKLLGLIRKPERKEAGIAQGTTAVMQTRKSYSAPTSAVQKLPPGEIWLMYRDADTMRKIISAWRYPGISRPGEAIPIPDDILNELRNHKSKITNPK